MEPLGQHQPQLLILLFAVSLHVFDSVIMAHPAEGLRVCSHKMALNGNHVNCLVACIMFLSHVALALQETCHMMMSGAAAGMMVLLLLLLLLS